MRIHLIVTVWALLLLSCASGSKGIENNINNTNNVNNVNNINNTNNTNNTNNCNVVCSDGESQCIEGAMLQVCALVSGCNDWVDNTDCSGLGQVCQVNGTSGDAECVDTCQNQCDTPGETRCTNNTVEECTLVSGCNEWVLQDNCVASGKECHINAQDIAECYINCEDACTQAGDTRCNSNIAQTCTLQANTCLDWDDTQNCTTSSQSCTTSGGTAHCETITGPNIYFSEYLEGSSTYKALEIYVASASGSFDMSTCTVKIYYNGNSTATASIALSALSLVTGDNYLLCSSSIENNGWGVTCDQYHGSLSFNGNDAVALDCGGTTYDVFGQIGTDPGTAWTSGGVTTIDTTLRRKTTVSTGDTNGTDAFAPDAEWEGFPQDSYTDLGTYP
ncbi:hypothetical protein KKF84_05510 [Myxococcota bacterium]|nr:hypothetical protein [Myxococcota bacterium]MBU1534755.1 hypothetical protein [Myxococcota bacterium]